MSLPLQNWNVQTGKWIGNFDMRKYTSTAKKQLHILIQFFHIFMCNIYLLLGKSQGYYTYKILFSINLRVILMSTLLKS